MANELTKLRREMRELRAALERKTEELDAQKRLIDEGHYVPLSDYEELADLAGILTDKQVSAARRQRRGPRSKTVTANEKAEFIWQAYRSAIAAGAGAGADADADEMKARMQANVAAGKKFGVKHVSTSGHYSERALRKIFKSK